MTYAIVDGDVYALPQESEALSSALYQLGLGYTLVYTGGDLGPVGDEPEAIVGVFYPGDKL